jgi:uncharacterized Tic20 family protein
MRYYFEYVYSIMMLLCGIGCIYVAMKIIENSPIIAMVFLLMSILSLATSIYSFIESIVGHIKKRT